MNYTNEEIVGLYKDSANKRKQIEILAELTCTSTMEVVRVLHEAGIYNRIDIDYCIPDLQDYFLEGGTLTELAGKYHVDNATMRDLLNSRNINTPKPGKPMKKKEKETVVDMSEKQGTKNYEYRDPINLIMDLGLNFTSGSALAYIIKASAEKDIKSARESLINAKNHLEAEIRHMELMID